MSSLSIPSSSFSASSGVRSVETKPADHQQTLKSLDSHSTLAQDTFSIQNAKIPTLKGAGAGALASGLGAAIFIKTPSQSSSLIAAVGGAIGGAVAANVTDDKAKGALIGAGVGAAVMVLGVAMFATQTTDTTALATLTRAAIGAASGAVGGVAGVAAQH